MPCMTAGQGIRSRSTSSQIKRDEREDDAMPADWDCWDLGSTGKYGNTHTQREFCDFVLVTASPSSSWKIAPKPVNN